MTVFMIFRAPLLFAVTLLHSACVNAAPADYVEMPVVEYGEKEIDFKLGHARKGAAPGASGVSIGYGWGATQRWFTEIIVKYKRDSGARTEYEAIEWENKFQLTETGKYPFEAALLLELERPNNHAEGWEMKWGPLLQTEIGKLQLNGNVFIARNHRAQQTSDSTLSWQWQARYHRHGNLEFGAQGFGKQGQWNRWLPRDQRIHQAGPAVFGKLELGNGQTLKYNAAWLTGTTTAAPDHTLRLQVEYER